MYFKNDGIFLGSVISTFSLLGRIDLLRPDRGASGSQRGTVSLSLKWARLLLTIIIGDGTNKLG